MELSGIALGRRSRARLDDLLARAEASEPTYDHVGSTLEPADPPDTGHHVTTLDAPGHVAAAKAALRAWAPHLGLPARIHPPNRPPDEGATVLVVLPYGPFEVVAPDRIVAVVDEPDRFGFAYGTLPGHPELGEELFLAEQFDDRTVRLTIRIHARPGTALTRIGAPIVGRFQRVAARRYLAAWAAAIAATPEGDPPC